MAEDKKSCYCGGVLAIVIVVLTLLKVGWKITGAWVDVVVLIAAILIVIGAFAGGCICTKLCKTEPPQQQGE